MPEIDFSPQVRSKGEEYLVRGRVSRHGSSVWRVDGSRSYVVNGDLSVGEDGRLSWSFLTCSCPHGQNTPRPSCSHVCAAMLHAVLEARGVLAKYVTG